jgi:uncharacterized protein (TIGR04255 family)
MLQEEYPILRKAPITEALIDIRVKLRKDFDISQLESIHGSISEQYPIKKIMKRREDKITIEEGKPTVSAGEEIVYGYRYISDDQKQIFQARIDGFTFNRLKPYVTWDNMRDEAYRLWKIYTDYTSPELITRVALRYINNLNIPMPIEDYGDFLTAPPIVPEELPQEVSSFLNRVQINEPSLKVFGIIIQALDQIIDPKFAPIILDIDVFKLNQDGFEGRDAWETIEKLRSFKNKIFFNSITNKLKEAYK